MIAVLAFLLFHLLTVLFPLPWTRPLFYTLLFNAGEGFERRLNRETRRPRELFLRGTFIAVLVAALAALAGRGFVVAEHDYPHGWIAAVIFLFCSVNIMQPLRLSRRIAKALKARNIRRAADLLQPFVRSSLEKADAFSVARQAVEFSAGGLNIWFMGPLFWYICAGAEAAMLYIAFSALYMSFGAGEGNRRFFGLVTVFFHSVLDFIPALLTALVIAIASVFVSKGNPLRSLRGTGEQILARKNPKDISRAAMAGALGVTLAGTGGGWIGPTGSSAKVMPEDLQRGVMLQFVFLLCVMMLASAAIIMNNIH